MSTTESIEGKRQTETDREEWLSSMAMEIGSEEVMESGYGEWLWRVVMESGYGEWLWRVVMESGYGEWVSRIHAK
jgi:hypothetical protein